MLTEDEFLVARENFTEVKDQPDYLRGQIELGKVWCMLIPLHPNNEIERKGVGFFCQHDYKDMTGSMNKIRDHCLGTDSLCLLLRGEVREKMIEMTQAWKNQMPNPYGQFFAPHPNKPFLQIGQVNDAKDKLPYVKSRAAASFYDMHEYIAKSGWGLVFEHAYEKASKGVGESLECEVITVFPPGRSVDGQPTELIGFLSITSYASQLEPGESVYLETRPFQDAELKELSGQSSADMFATANDVDVESKNIFTDGDAQSDSPEGHTQPGATVHEASEYPADSWDLAAPSAPWDWNDTHPSPEHSSNNQQPHNDQDESHEDQAQAEVTVTSDEKHDDNDNDPDAEA